MNFKSYNQYFDFLKKIPPFLISKMIWIFLIILILAASYLIYIWYFFVFNSAWSEEKKQEYLNTYGKEATLDENRFGRVVDEFSKRKDAYNLESETVEDIFQLK